MIGKGLRAVATLVRRCAWEGERLRWRLFHPITLGARVALLRGEEVLLIRHTYRDGWYLPGGGVDKGESLEAAARREAEEEVGAEVGELSLLGVYSNFSEHKSDHVAIFYTRDFTLGEFTANNEIAARRWFSLHSLPAEVSSGTARRLQELAAGKAPVAGNW
ncbi:MAG: NUDIX domain-containing protein [Dehalococcoidia bacterium]